MEQSLSYPTHNLSAANDYLFDLDEECNEDDESEEAHEAIVSTSHYLPLKELGTCYTAERQKAPEESYEYLYEHNRPLFVKLRQNQIIFMIEMQLLFTSWHHQNTGK